MTTLADCVATLIDAPATEERPDSTPGLATDL